MPTRDESILILDLTSTILRAGVGVHDLIRGPHVVRPSPPPPPFLSDEPAYLSCLCLWDTQGLVTRLGRKSGTTGTAIEDYLVGSALFQAEAEQRQNPSAEAKFETVNPLRVDERTGFEVTDWVGLEAVLCVSFFFFPSFLYLSLFPLGPPRGSRTDPHFLTAVTPSTRSSPSPARPSRTPRS